MLTNQTILEQLLACEIALNRHREVEELLSLKIGNGNCDLRYYLGVNYAAQGKFEESLAELISVLENNPSHQMAKNMAFKLLLRKARQKVKEKNFGEISSVLSMAVDLAPDTPDARKELACFKNALPISHMKAGKRKAAANLWEEELRKHPTDHNLIHNLALLYYWWALSEEAKAADSSTNNGNSGICRIWEKSISYWVVLLGMPMFWSEWKNEKEEIWNLEIKTDDLKKFRESFLEEKLMKIFNDYIDLYKQNGKNQESSRHEDYLLTLLLEKESAIKWSAVFEILNNWKGAMDINNLDGIKRYELVRAIQKAQGNTPCFGTIKDCRKNSDECLWSKSCQTDRNRELYFNIPGGRQFFQDANMLPEVYNLIELLHIVHPDNEVIGKLRFYLHPGGLGRVLILLEQGKKPQRAMAELERLLDNKLVDKGDLDVKYINAFAHMERGRSYYKEGNKFNEALDDWTCAKGLIMDAQRLSGHIGNSSYRNFIASLRDEIESLVVSGCEKEAKKYKQADKLDDAISVLLKGLKLVSHPANKSLSDHIAIFYCEKGDKRIADKNFSKARKEFENALKYVPNYARAKKGIGTAYNNEGVSKGSPEQSIPLFEKAIQYDSDDNVVKQNLAGAYNGKAVSILNALTQYSSYSKCDDAISLLKNALKILNPSLDMSLIDSFAYMDMEESLFKSFTMKLPDDFYKTVLHNLWVACRSRKNLRGY